MALTFDWAESAGTQVQVEPRVIATQMGDGYSQRIPDGINSMPDKWDMRFNEVSAESGDLIIGFFEQHLGCIAFNWTAPRRTASGLYVCKSWSRTLPDLIGNTDISARFERTYEP